MCFVPICGSQAKEAGAFACGAKVVLAELDPEPHMARVEIVGDRGSWEIKKGEAWTGVNPHEFFFTLEGGSGEEKPPTVRVIWPEVRISRVLGAAGAVTNTADGVTFAVGRSRAPTSVGTSLAEGAVHMHVFHNWEARRAGSYRGGRWPAAEIQAQLNYLFAAREMCRAMGYASTSQSGFKGDIRLYGFESNFPNGHVDHPPHFHIMLGWPGWTGTQAGHFLLDQRGRVTENRLIADYGGRQEHAVFSPGEVCRMSDPDGKLGFELVVMSAGEGVIMRRAEGQPEFRIGPDDRQGRAVDAVTVFRRETHRAGWTRLCSVRAEDDAAKGLMSVAVTRDDGAVTTESIAYDVDTGARVSAGAR